MGTGAAAACKEGACHGWEKGIEKNTNQEETNIISFFLILKGAK